MNRPYGPNKTNASNERLADLLDRVAKQQDKAAFAELFEHFGPRVKGFMMRKGADGELAEDLAQDTMITVWRKAHMYSGDKGSVSTWIFTIARNRRIDWARKLKGMQFSDISEVEQPSDDRPADEIVLGNQEAKSVAAAVEQLPSDQKQVISMAFMEDMTQQEISQRLDLPLGTVKSRMRLAYQKLSKSLEALQ
ncbi:MAG: sigma-70 family RNA polymerase sigma factor [Rhizobiales bacterium]|nr:sigma-70 family RNA polymerase sigma factor [Hyphomicrobiales bacterium]